MICLTVLGATGSIGVSTLEVVNLHREKYKIVALTAHQNIELLIKQCIFWEPEYAVIDNQLADRLKTALADAGLTTTVLSGIKDLQYVATLPEVDCIVAAIVGAAGLLPTLAAAESGKRILLANKESLVMSGQLFMDIVRTSGAELLPIDSEHNAIFQCMPVDYTHVTNSGVESILLTASGGPFRETTLDQLSDVSPEEACTHPNWDMGKKISVDCATMMNKGLELIEACWLFNIHHERVQIILHPQSIIHSMVQYADGSVLGQLSNPDIRTAIAHALAWPQRMDSGVAPLNLLDIQTLNFASPDTDKFPCLQLAREAILAGGTATIVMNAANEIAVGEFLNKRLKFLDIPKLIEAALENISITTANSIADILAADTEARQYCLAYANEI